MQKERYKSPDKEITDLLKDMDPENLREFIARYAAWNSSFKKDVVSHFRPPERKSLVEDYRKQAAACFKSRGRYRRNYDYYEAAYEAEQALYGMLEKAVYLVSQNNFTEAAAIAQSIIEVVPRHYEEVDDSDGGLGMVFSDTIAFLLGIAGNENADEKLKKEMYQWVVREGRETVYSDYGFDDFDSMLIPVTQAAGMFHEALDLAEERIHTARNEYLLEKAVLDKLQLLRQQGLDNEIALTISQYIDLAGVREIKVADLLGRGRHEEAIMLIKEGIALAGKRNETGMITDWKDRLLQIYIDMGDRKNTLKYAEELFYDGQDMMKYYHILKKESEPERWAKRLDELLDGLTGYHDYVLAQICIEEGYWERLLKIAEKSGLYGLEKYESYLKDHFPGELLNLFAMEIVRYADRHMGRKHYRYIASLLKNLRFYPGGHQVINRLLEDFTKKYRARTAMMEELREV